MVQNQPEARMKKDPYIPTDRYEELDRVDLDTVFSILDVYCQTLLLDMESSLTYLSRILRDKESASNPLTRIWVPRLVRKAAAFAPLDPKPLGLAHGLTGDPVLGERLQRLTLYDMESSLCDVRSAFNFPDKLRRKRAKFMRILEEKPGHIPAASMLLLLDYYEGVERGDWLGKLTVPKFFQDVWKQRLFVHLAGLSAADEALKLWDELQHQPHCEVQLNMAAAMYAKQGDVENALALYRRSLEIDQSQHPLRLRMAELEHPFVPDASLTEKRDVTICLYSWNKADNLEMTLRGLARTNIGKARIRILLNGCTDRSLEVVTACRALFPDTDYAWVSAPVNVGAPAARNWLGAMPEVRASEFVAYLDDDVEIPEDWLAHYLTIMDRHPDTSVVGCKVVHSFEPRRIQYLHRRFTLAATGMIKLTDPCQITQMDCGHYDYICETDTVMGCCHLLRMAHLPDGPKFDLRYSPSQVDDIVHDLELRLAGRVVRYCGLVRCIHHQNTGGMFDNMVTPAKLGQILGNDTKFYFAFEDRLEKIREVMRTSSF